MESLNHIVDYAKYCKICKYREKEGYEDPCNICLIHQTNENSRRPVNFEERETSENSRK